MPSLRELQQAFAAAVLAPQGTAPEFALAGRGRDGAIDGPARTVAGTAHPFAGATRAPAVAIGDAALAAERIGIYRNAIFANYRHALGASFPVVLRLVGEPFFNAAVDAFVHAHPSVSGDLNVYGDAFGDFLAGYPHAAGLPYLADVARLEWAVDEAQRAGDSVPAPERVLAALAAAAPERLPALRLRLDPSCRLVASAFPILHIWQANQSECASDDRVGFDEGDDFVGLDNGDDFVDLDGGDDRVDLDGGDDRVDLDEGADTVVVRRGANGVALVRVAAGEHAFLAALAADAAFGSALDAAQRVDAAFDLGATLRANIAAGIITAVAA